MNKEIKIKFWDEENKSMSKSFGLLEYINLIGDARYFSGKGEAFSGNNKDNSTRWHEKRLPIEYTGLKDKNGKEIYEGDILSADPILKVIFENGGFCFSNHSSSGADRLSQDRVGRLEVIGNIYENPELLK